MNTTITLYRENGEELRRLSNIPTDMVYFSGYALVTLHQDIRKACEDVRELGTIYVEVDIFDENGKYYAGAEDEWNGWETLTPEVGAFSQNGEYYIRASIIKYDL